MAARTRVRLSLSAILLYNSFLPLDSGSPGRNATAPDGAPDPGRTPPVGGDLAVAAGRCCLRNERFKIVPGSRSFTGPITAGKNTPTPWHRTAPYAQRFRIIKRCASMMRRCPLIRRQFVQNAAGVAGSTDRR